MSYGGQSNPPWQRKALGNTNQANTSNMQNQMGLQNPMHYQNSTLFNQNISMSQQPPNQNVAFSQLSGNINQMQTTPQPLFSQTVSYPGPGNRGQNSNAFSANSNQSGGSQQNQHSGYNSIGIVTKIHNDCGFIDDEIFFHKNVCKGAVPKVGDRVLVEGSYNQNSPFKLSATRIQVVSSVNVGNGGSSNISNIPRNQPPPLMGTNVKGSVYSAVPPPNEYARALSQRRMSPRRSLERSSSRKESRIRDDNEVDRKRRREERDRERDNNADRRDHSSEKRERSPRRSSPKRRRTRAIPRYMVQIPKISLNITEADVLEIRRRYTNMYIPSDFFFSKILWSKSFKPDNPFSIQRPCSFHIMHKAVNPPEDNVQTLDPSDADYLYSAKVMLMGAPPITEIYQKCLYDEKEREGDRDFIHPTRLINFLVGIRGKNETMPIGGPWSPSLDGENPQNDPMVLIKTAIRTCRGLTNIDLSACTQWYKFVELYYHRGETTQKGRVIPARIETVVIFLPDINSCMPTRLEWDNLQRIYKSNLERMSNQVISEVKNYSSLNASATLASKSYSVSEAGGAELENRATENPSGEQGHEKEDHSEKISPTHYSDLDVKNMKIQDLRDELSARNLSCKGLKPQLVARLTKALNTEKAQNDRKTNDEDSVKADETESTRLSEETEQQNEELVEGNINDTLPMDESDDKKELESSAFKKEPPKKLNEKERQQLERRYQLPETPHIIVHPSTSAKSGKFDCTVMSLSVLLDYRPEDTKERSFEVSIFAELFNEMLMRDFGFNIYKEVVELPEIPKDKDGKNKEEDKNTAAENDEKTKENIEQEKSRERRISDSDRSDRKATKDQDKKVPKKSYDDDTEDDDYSIKSGDKRKRSKTVVTKPELLLSFIYFDTTHCGYIFEKDLEELFYIIGLNLSRAQVRKLLGKIILRDAVYYRKLTDKAKDEDKGTSNESTDNNDTKIVDVAKLAQGNKLFLMKNEYHNSNPVEHPTGMVSYNGGLLDVDNLMEQTKRSEKAREEIEKILIDLRKQNSDLQSNNTKATTKIKDLQSEKKNLSRKLNDAEQNISSLNKKYNEYCNILSSIYDKISPIFLKPERSSKAEGSRDKEREKDHERERDREKDESKESSKADIKKEKE